MFKPVPMAKVAIVGPKSKLADTVETLHRMRLLHIQDYTADDEFFDLGSPLPQGSKIAERLLRVRGVMKGADMAPPKDARPYTIKNLKALEEKLQEVEEELVRLVDERAKLQDEFSALEERRAALARVADLTVPTSLLSGYGAVATQSGFVSPEADLGVLKSVHEDVDWFATKEPEGTFIAVFAPKAAEKALATAVAQLGLQPVELPATERPPREELVHISARMAELEGHLGSLNEKVTAIRERYAAAFFALDEYLSIEADKATAPVRFRTSPNSFMIEGWIPHDTYAKLESNLQRVTQNGVFITRTTRAARSRDRPSHGTKDAHGEDKHVVEDVPVMLRNPKRSGPYELLTDTYSRPKYTELDPTLFMYIGFPLFYGVMLGDVGYGAILLVMVVTGVFRKIFSLFGFQSLWHLNRIFLHAALSSMLFGLLYGEFFGLEMFGPHGVFSHYETHFGPFPYPFSRLENVKMLLALTLVIGAIHLFVGLVVGMRNAAAEHGMGDAIKHRGSWLAVLLAVILAGIAIVPDTLQLGADEHAEPVPGAPEPAHKPIIANKTPLLAAAGLIFLVGVVLLVMGEGGIALLELPTVIANLLSYTRLLAIGLSGVGIALAGNKMAALMLTGGWIGIFGALIVLLLAHSLGVVLGIIGPALHSLRLHYVEFFTKFYSGGGTPYEPFGAQPKYTVQEVKQA